LLSKTCPRCKKVAKSDADGFTCITCGWNEYIIPDPPKELTGSVPLIDKFFLVYKGTNPKYRHVRASIITFLYLTPKKKDKIIYFMDCPRDGCGVRTAGSRWWQYSIRKLEENYFRFLCTDKHLWYLVVLNGEPLYWLTHNMEVDMPKVGKKHFSYTAKGRTAAKKYAKKTGKKMTRKSY